MPPGEIPVLSLRTLVWQNPDGVDSLPTPLFDQLIVLNFRYVRLKSHPLREHQPPGRPGDRRGGYQ